MGVPKRFRESRNVFLCPLVSETGGGGGGAEMSWEFIHFDYLSDRWSVTDKTSRNRHHLNRGPLKMSFVLMRWRMAHWGRPNMAAQG